MIRHVSNNDAPFAEKAEKKWKVRKMIPNLIFIKNFSISYPAQ